MDQLTKFDRALRDFSAASGGQERGIDGMLVTKWDTVDDKVGERPSRTMLPCPLSVLNHRSCGQVGAALSMTYVTGQPIIFVGCGQVCLFLSPTCAQLITHVSLRGQTYTDLRQLRVANVVQAILSD